MFCLTSLRRHLARIHSTNYKCEKCGKGFQEETRYKAHMDIHRLRECHLCGKIFARKQNADIHLIGIDVSKFIPTVDQVISFRNLGIFTLKQITNKFHFITCKILGRFSLGAYQSTIFISIILKTQSLPGISIYLQFQLPLNQINHIQLQKMNMTPY